MMSTRKFCVSLSTVIAVVCLFQESVVLGNTGKYYKVKSRNMPLKERLVKDLMRYYEASVEPDDIVLNAGFAVICSRYDRATSELTTSGWERYRWTDSRLRWNPEHYGRIKSIHLPSKLIWVPDFKVYNSLRSVEERDYTYAIVVFNGSVIWIPSVLYRTPCSSDSQGTGLNCQINIGPWTYDSETVKLEFYDSGIDLGQYLNATCPLKVDSGSSQIHTKKYPCCVENYNHIEYNIRFKP